MEGRGSTPKVIASAHGIAKQSAVTFTLRPASRTSNVRRPARSSGIFLAARSGGICQTDSPLRHNSLSGKRPDPLLQQICPEPPQTGTHKSPSLMNPLPHRKSQRTPSHVAVDWAGWGHRVQPDPHALVSLLATQRPLHPFWFPLQQMLLVQLSFWHSSSSVAGLAVGLLAVGVLV